MSPQVKTWGYDEKSPLKGLPRLPQMSFPPLSNKFGEGPGVR
jgi:hypothetical protein